MRVVKSKFPNFQKYTNENFKQRGGGAPGAPGVPALDPPLQLQTKTQFKQFYTERSLTKMDARSTE